jgi:hypothetical protein
VEARVRVMRELDRRRERQEREQDAGHHVARQVLQ